MNRGLRGLVERVRQRDGDPAADLAQAASAGERSLEPATLAALGLHEQPFTDQTAPDALFRDAAIDMQINSVASRLDDGVMLPWLKGEAGAGKTSVLIQLIARRMEHYHFFIVRGGDTTTAERTLIDMLRVLTQPVPDDPQACFRALARELRHLVGDGAPAVLIVDDADAFADRKLEHLLAACDSLDSALGGRFHIALAACPAFELRLSGLHSRDLDRGRVMATTVRPLQRDRIGPYLGWRLQAADGDPPFDADDLDRIAQAGEGLPRAIEAAAACLLNARHAG